MYNIWLAFSAPSPPLASWTLGYWAGTAHKTLGDQCSHHNWWFLWIRSGANLAKGETTERPSFGDVYPATCDRYGWHQADCRWFQPGTWWTCTTAHMAEVWLGQCANLGHLDSWPWMDANMQTCDWARSNMALTSRALDADNQHWRSLCWPQNAFYPTGFTWQELPDLAVASTSLGNSYLVMMASNLWCAYCG